MRHYATATISETQPDTSALRRKESRRTRTHDGSGPRQAVKGFALVPLYVWDDLEPAELQRRSEWHDPAQPAPRPTDPS